MPICSRSAIDGPWRAFAFFCKSFVRVLSHFYGGRNDSGRIGVIGHGRKAVLHPIRIHIAGLGTVRYVSDVHEALDCLMYGWPAEHNSQHARAIETCLNVVAKGGRAHEAEAAFNDAAVEAGILQHGPGHR